MKQALPILAAWLHDIGKFAQRAEAPCSTGMEQEYCPSGGTHRHVLYTDYFIENLLPLPAELEADRSRLARMASAHHRADEASREEVALQEADRLSSGGDRMDGEADGSYKTARLESVFTNIRLGDKGITEDVPILRYRLLPLDSADVDNPAIFPVEGAEKKGTYKALWSGFLKALQNGKSLPLGMGVRPYVSSLASLLERFTWCIPSSTYHTRADISLYDHAATTAAITQALLACADKEQGLLLCGGELSGIQKFIFGAEGQADKGASKLLRARSLYLQALTRSVWLTLLDRLGLAPAAKIMDAGGRFVLLLPDTSQSRQACAQLRGQVEEWLLKNFQGAVRMAFAIMPMQPQDLERSRFCDCFENFNDALENAKLRPFETFFASGASPIVPVKHDDYAQYGECDCCRSRPAAGFLDDGTPVCVLCRKLMDKAGRLLPAARHLVFTRSHRGIELFGGLNLRIESNAPESMLKGALDVLDLQGEGGFSSVPVAAHVPIVEQKDMEKWRAEGSLQEIDRLYCMLGEAVASGSPKTFAMLAEEGRVQEDDGRKRSMACLAACKADVDNLGLIFGIGFGSGEKSLFSISRFAMLSRMMNHFFAAHVPALIRQHFPNIYLVFAGGDDLFALGPWAETIAFARRLRSDFQRFTGNNPAVSFSAGLPVFKPRQPMRAVRKEAETCLEASKHCPGKDAVTLFGVTAHWPPFAGLLDTGRWLENLCLDGAVTQGFVRRLLGYARACAEFDAGDISKGLYLAHLAYDMKRNCDPYKVDIERIWRMAQNRDEFPMQELGITWALYRTRFA